MYRDAQPTLETTTFRLGLLLVDDSFSPRPFPTPVRKWRCVTPGRQVECHDASYKSRTMGSTYRPIDHSLWLAKIEGIGIRSRCKLTFSVLLSWGSTTQAAGRVYNHGIQASKRLYISRRIILFPHIKSSSSSRPSPRSNLLVLVYLLSNL
jgi:hypothetical protein